MTSVNVNQWIQCATRRLESAELFYGHGTDNARDEAAWLILDAIGAEPDGRFRDWDAELSAEQEERVRACLDTRVESGLPLAYILGTAWFAGLEFEVNPAVLVPRSPIAELVREEFAPWIDSPVVRTALDLCTGSGCIGIAMAVYMPWLRIDASDVSAAALAVARRNVHRHGVGSRVRLVQSDLFAALGHASYDLIVANPPYVSPSTLENLPREYRSEPEIGLVSGSDGLDACLRIMVQSPDYMNPGGTLICEVGESGRRLAELLPSVPFVWLEFRSGGTGVFVLTREELMRSSAAIRNLVEEGADVR